jgi:hypothetical protein
MSNLNQKGPGILKNTLTSSELGKQMGQIGKDLKRSVSPITKPLAESTKSTATTLGKGLGIDTKQVANDVKGLRGEGGSENSTPNTSASKEKPVKQSPSIASKSAMGSAVTSAASSALTSPEGSEGGMGKPEPPKATGGHQSSPEPHTKTKKKSAAKEQAKRGAIVNQIKKAKKDK